MVYKVKMPISIKGREVMEVGGGINGDGAPGGGYDGHAGGLHHGGDGVEEEAVAEGGLPEEGGRLPGEGRPQGHLAGAGLAEHIGEGRS